MSSPFAQRLRLRPTLEWREVEGEIVALHLGRSVYLAANPTGAALWRQLSAGATREELIDSLVATHGLARSAAASDVDAFLAALQAQDCLEP